MTTGPAHWEISFRQRAIENQIYMVGTAAAQNPDAGYVGYGHSIITDPWGRVLMQMGTDDCSSVDEIDIDYIETVRARLPLMSARRTDLYSLDEIKTKGDKL
jgi:predicted amidohydrolase